VLLRRCNSSQIIAFQPVAQCWMPIQWRRRKGVSFQHITPWPPLGKGGSVRRAKKIYQDVSDTRVIWEGLTRQHILDIYSPSNSSQFLIFAACDKWNCALEIMEWVRVGSGNVWMNRRDTRRCLKASWKTEHISDDWRVSMILFIPGNNISSVLDGHR